MIKRKIVLNNYKEEIIVEKVDDYIDGYGVIFVYDNNDEIIGSIIRLKSEYIISTTEIQEIYTDLKSIIYDYPTFKLMFHNEG